MKYYIFVRFRVRDYTNWRAEFDLQKEWRKSKGEINCQTFRDEYDHNMVTLIYEWESEESVKKFLEDPQLSEIMQFAGVMEHPTLNLLIKD